MEALQLLKLQNGVFSCEVIANYGAALNSYKYNGVEFVDGYTSAEQILTQKYKGVVLAPFPNRIAKGIYSFEGKTFHLPINREKEGLALHGFLYNKPFEISQASKNEACLVYHYDKELESYPFKFQLKVQYSLQENGKLCIHSSILNLSNRFLPFGLGWHPYFKIGESINDLKLSFPSSTKLLLDDKAIPTGVEEVFHSKTRDISLSEYSFDDCFRLNQEDDLAFTLSKDKVQLSVRSKSLNDFGFFQIYTPKNRSTIAIEPMTCAPNAFNNNIGLISLQPNEERSFEYSIQAW